MEFPGAFAEPMVMQAISDKVQAIQVARGAAKVHRRKINVVCARIRVLHAHLLDSLHGVAGAPPFTCPAIVTFADAVLGLATKASEALSSCSRGTLFSLIHFRSLADQVHSLNLYITETVEEHRMGIALEERSHADLITLGTYLTEPISDLDPSRDSVERLTDLQERGEAQAYLLGNTTPAMLIRELARAGRVVSADIEELQRDAEEESRSSGNVGGGCAAHVEARIAMHEKLRTHLERALIELQPVVAVPADFLCPITNSVMWDPVVVPETGMCYDRELIEQWFSQGARLDPKTGAEIKSTVLAPVHAVRIMIREYLRQREPFRGVREEEWPNLNCGFRQLEVDEVVQFNVAPEVVRVESGGELSLRAAGDEQPEASAPPYSEYLSARSSLSLNEDRLLLPPDSPTHSIDDHHPEWRHGNYMLYSGAEDNKVKLWDLNNRCVKSMRGHSKWVMALAVGNDGTVYSGGLDHTVRLWKNGCHVSTLEGVDGHSGSVYSLAVSRAGLVYSGSGDWTVKCWRDRACAATLKGHSGLVSSVVVAPSGVIYSGSWDGKIKKWSADDHRLLATLEGHSGGVNAMALSPDGVLFSVGKDRVVRTWHNDRLAGELRGHTKHINVLAFDAEGVLWTGGQDDTVRKWIAGTCAGTLKANGIVVSLACGPDGCLYVGAAGTSNTLFKKKNDNAVSIWRDSKRQGYLHAQDSGSVYALAIGPELQANHVSSSDSFRRSESVGLT